jgi:hypothetical protein
VPWGFPASPPPVKHVEAAPHAAPAPPAWMLGRGQMGRATPSLWRHAPSHAPLTISYPPRAGGGPPFCLPMLSKAHRQAGPAPRAPPPSPAPAHLTSGRAPPPLALRLLARARRAPYPRTCFAASAVGLGPGGRHPGSPRAPNTGPSQQTAGAPASNRQRNAPCFSWGTAPSPPSPASLSPPVIACPCDRISRGRPAIVSGGPMPPPASVRGEGCAVQRRPLGAWHSAPALALARARASAAAGRSRGPAAISRPRPPAM